MCGKICGTPEKTAAAILHPYLPKTVKQNIFVLSVMDWIQPNNANMVYWFGFTTVGNRPNHSVQRFVFSINSDNQVIKPKLRAPLTLTSLLNSFFIFGHLHFYRIFFVSISSIVNFIAVERYSSMA